jgi:hypothetical protein
VVYSRARAQSFLGRSDPPGHATVQTFTTDGSRIQTYAHFATGIESDHEDSKYHQYLTSDTPLLASLADFKRGRLRIRNCQDSAKEASEALKDDLIAHNVEDNSDGYVELA